MPQETEITYVLGKGLDLQTNPIVAEGMAELQNCEFERDGCIKVRQATVDTDLSTSLPSVMSMVCSQSNTDRYFCASSNYLGHRQINDVGSIEYGKTPECFIDYGVTFSPKNGIVRSASSAVISAYKSVIFASSSTAETAAASELSVVYRDRQNIVSVGDVTAIFTSSAITPGTYTNSPRVMYQSGFSYVQFLAEGDDPAGGVVANKIVGSIALVGGAPSLAAANYVSDSMNDVYAAWDCCPIPGTDDFIIVYKQYAAGGGPWPCIVNRYSQHNAPTVNATVTCTNTMKQDSFVACCVVGTDVYVTFIDAANDAVVQRIDASGGTLSLGTIAVYDNSFGATDAFYSGHMTSMNIGAASTGLMVVFTAILNAGAGDEKTYVYSLQDITGTLGTVMYANYKSWNRLLTRTFKENGINYFFTSTTNEGTKSSYYLWSFFYNGMELAGACLHDRASVLPYTAGLSDRRMLNDATTSGVCLPAYQEIGNRDLRIYDVIFKRGIIKNQTSNTVTAAGGALREYRANVVFDGGFVCHPSIHSATLGAGGSIDAGDVRYIVAYEYVDRLGVLHRSRPSTAPIAAHATSAPGNQTVDVAIRIPTCFSYNKNNDVVVKLYRRHDAGSTNYIYTGLFARVPSYGSATVVLTDTLSIASIATNPVLYTTDEYEAYPIPPSVGIAAGGDRLYLLSGDNRKEVWASKPISQYVYPEFGNGITISFPEEIFAISSYANKIYAFARDRVYSFYGDGPNIKGESGSFSQPALEPAIGGCMNPWSVHVLPSGIFYQSGASGWPNWIDSDSKWNDFLLVGSEPRSIGKQSTAYSGRVQLVQSVADAKSKDTLYLACGSLLSGDQYNPYVLVYNYRLDVWSIFYFSATKNVAHSEIYAGKWIFCTYNGRVLTPGTASYDTPVIITTPWLNPSGNLFTTFKAWWMTILGDKSTSTSRTITVAIYYDGEPSSTTSMTKTITTFSPWYMRALLARRCRSVRIKISFNATTEDVSFYAVKLTCGVYGAAHKPIGGSSSTI